MSCNLAIASFIGLDSAKANIPYGINSDIYRIGELWGKKLVDIADFKKYKNLKKIATATVAVSGATGFYLGEFHNSHIVATNYHVCPKAYMCEGKNAGFSFLKKRLRIKKWLGAWSEIDLALVVIDVPKTMRPLMSSIAAPFDFHGKIYQEQKLITAGFGIADNPFFNLMVNMDDDCKVFSAPEDFRFIEDPDMVSKGSYKAWSFANGCDVSHGDSGSPIMDRETGSVVGIMWTGKVPKSFKIQKPDYLASILVENSEVIWEELSYGVPATKIYQVLTDKINNEEIPEKKTRKILADLLN